MKHQFEKEGAAAPKPFAGRPIEWPDGARSAFCFRVDVETVHCLRHGVPAMLKAFDEYEVKATFFVPMGPDRLGRSFKPQDVPRYLQLDPMKKFGVKNLLHGLLLPSPDMGQNYGPELRQIDGCGHEVGLHGFGHADWARSIQRLPDDEVEHIFHQGYRDFIHVFELQPKGFASPEFKVTEKVLELLDRYDFLYGSDVRGQFPFRPQIRGQSFRTLQVPVTLPNLEELRWKGLSDVEAYEHLCSKIEKNMKSGGLGVLLMHPSYEGLWKHRLFSALLKFLGRRREELWVTTLKEAADWWIRNA